MANLFYHKNHNPSFFLYPIKTQGKLKLNQPAHNEWFYANFGQ